MLGVEARQIMRFLIKVIRVEQVLYVYRKIEGFGLQLEGKPYCGLKFRAY